MNHAHLLSIKVKGNTQDLGRDLDPNTSHGEVQSTDRDHGHHGGLHTGGTQGLAPGVRATLPHTTGGEGEHTLGAQCQTDVATTETEK